MDANDLISLSDKLIGDQSNMPDETGSKSSKAKKRCLIYWVEDRLVSTEPITAVVNQSEVKEGAVCQIKWRGKGPYLGKIIKISDDKNVLKKEQEEIEMQLMNVPSSSSVPQTMDDAETSKRGRKRIKSKKVLEQESEEEDQGEPRKKMVKETVTAKDKVFKETVTAKDKVVKETVKAKDKVVKETVTGTAKDKLAAKVAAQRALFSDFMACDEPCTSYSELLADNDGLDGVVRALEVANDPDIEFLGNGDFLGMETLQSTQSKENDDLKGKIQSLKSALYEKNTELYEKDTELDEKNTELDEKNSEILKLKLKLHSAETAGCSTCKGGLPASQLVVTPTKVKFLKDLCTVISNMGPPALSSVSAPLGSQITLQGKSPANSSAPNSNSAAPNSSPNASTSIVPSVLTTPRHSSDSHIYNEEEKVELVKGTGVYVTVADRTAIALKGKKGVPMMLRKILELLFTFEELRNGCAVGGRPKAANKTEDVCSVPLDSRRVNASKAYILCYCQKRALPPLTEKDINSIINSKCVGARRKHREEQKK